LGWNLGIAAQDGHEHRCCFAVPLPIYPLCWVPIRAGTRGRRPLSLPLPPSTRAYTPTHCALLLTATTTPTLLPLHPPPTAHFTCAAGLPRALPTTCLDRTRLRGLNWPPAFPVAPFILPWLPSTTYAYYSTNLHGEQNEHLPRCALLTWRQHTPAAPARILPPYPYCCLTVFGTHLAVHCGCVWLRTRYLSETPHDAFTCCRSHPVHPHSGLVTGRTASWTLVVLPTFPGPRSVRATGRFTFAFCHVFSTNHYPCRTLAAHCYRLRGCDAHRHPPLHLPHHTCRCHPATACAA